MRSPSRTQRARALATLLAASVLLGIAAGPLASADDLADKKQKIQREIAGVHDNLDESSAQLRQAASALAAARAQLASAQAHLAETRGELAAAEVLDKQMQARLEAAVIRLKEATADLAAGRRKIAAQERALGQIVVANFQTGNPSLMGLSMVLTSQDPTALTAQLNSVHNVIDKEAVVLDRLEATRALATVQEQEVAAAKADVERKRTAAAENLVRKQSLEVQAEGAEAQVANLVSLRSEAEQKADRAKQADLAQLRGMESERNRIAALLQARAEEARRRSAAAAARAGAAGGPILGDGGPIHSNGFLDYPVAGSVTSPFGWRVHPIYGYRALHDGIDFAASCGTPIHATADGTVLESYYQSAWGNRVIIDHGFHHGVGVATISNHMSGPAIVAPGQHVSRGQIVGYVGTTGWSTGCHLHFTVLQNGSPVDPQNWF